MTQKPPMTSAAAKAILDAINARILKLTLWLIDRPPDARFSCGTEVEPISAIPTQFVSVIDR